MKILFIAPDHDEHRTTFAALKAAAPEHDVTWCEGVFHDLYKHLPEKIYFRQIEPAVAGGHNVVSFAPDHFDIAVIDMSHDEKWEGVLDYAGAARPDELTEALTWVGTVCIGTSREGKYLGELSGNGAVMTCAQDKLPTEIKGMLLEAERIAYLSRHYTGTGLLALTLRQPWAMSLFTCGKDLENRQWSTKVRRTIAVHVAQEQPEGSFEQGATFINKLMRWQKRAEKSPAYDRAQRGAIIGLVDIGGIVTENSSPWFEGPLGFQLFNPRLLPKPVPCIVSKRRFFLLDEASQAAIEQQLPPPPPAPKAPKARKSAVPRKRSPTKRRRASRSRGKGKGSKT